MDENYPLEDRRKRDPYIDRRSGIDRRKVYDADYWDSEGIERRRLKDRRKQKELALLGILNLPLTTP